MSISSLFKYKNSHYIHKVLLISKIFTKKSSAKCWAFANSPQSPLLRLLICKQKGALACHHLSCLTWCHLYKPMIPSDYLYINIIICQNQYYLPFLPFTVYTLHLIIFLYLITNYFVIFSSSSYLLITNFKSRQNSIFLFSSLNKAAGCQVGI